MEPDEKGKEIELYSEEVQEILGSPPHKIVSWGISLLFVVAGLILLASWLFKYPDIIVTQITVTTKNIPANLVAKSSGKITGLYAKDNDIVASGQRIAVIENPAVTEDVVKLKDILNAYTSENWLNDSLYNKINGTAFVLGENEPSFSLFRSKLGDFIKFTRRNFSERKIAALRNQLNIYKGLIMQLQEQINLQNEDLVLANNKFLRDSGINAQQFLSTADLEVSKAYLIQKKFTVETARTTLTNTRIQYSQLEQQILELTIERSAENENFELSLKELLSNLKASIAQWEQKYLLVSPVDGKLTFSKIWSLNQNIFSGELVVTVVPETQGEIIGILKLPVAGSGKVKTDQKVNVKFSSYPYMEFGMVTGRINKISLVPDQNYYLAEVAFPEGLTTNYKKHLTLIHEMTGSAEIITQDMRLIERFFNPVKSLLKERI